MKSKPSVSLTGIQPSGDVHIGNYLGMIKPALALQKEFECIYFVADLHALTTIKDGTKIKQYTLDLVATWIVLGLDTSKHILFRQSDLPWVTEFTWYLSTFTGMGLVEKCHAYKDARVSGREVNLGVFNYPVLMAADILLYGPDVVPVGKDQIQHVEVARDIAGSVNAILGEEVLKLPQVKVQEDVMTIPGLDGQKMSKSYNNTIPLFSTESTLKKLLLSIKTDSTPLEEPKVLQGSLLSDLYKLFSTNEQWLDLSDRLAKGGLGWGHAKLELFEIINTYIAGYRKEYYELRKDENFLLNVLKNGAEKARPRGEVYMKRIREKLLQK